MIPDERVAEVVSRLTGVPADRFRGRVVLEPRRSELDALDSLDRVELLLEFEEEFGAETVRWALRYLEAIAQASERARRSGGKRSPA
jgi:acyl carrier protein